MASRSVASLQQRGAVQRRAHRGGGARQLGALSAAARPRLRSNMRLGASLGRRTVYPRVALKVGGG